MLFNSLNFAIFLPVVFLLYWLASKGNLKLQNIILLVSSYFFYACWDWRFMFLLIFSTFLDYYTGLKIEEAESNKLRTFWLWLSIVINLGFLGFFKYYNFFAESFAESVKLLGGSVSIYTLDIMLPVGISFYTFHGLSYVLDIYYKRIKPEKQFVEYSVFVSFFPLLVAGPIERATHLLPQILRKREFNYTKAINGLRQILWGLFKKIVIADNCAEHANIIFNNSAEYSGSTLLLGAFFFTFQIYCDFSGYSDIALGTARLFGIELIRNFAFPYFSRDIAEFWRRWHISLSSWFKDYLYIPLGGSKGGTFMRIRNTFIIFIVSGFWHGANWTFIVWGFLNALFIIPSIIRKTNRNNIEIVSKGKLIPSLNDTISILTTFTLTVFAWIFFRCNNISQAVNFVSEIFSPTFISLPSYLGETKSKVITIALVLIFITIEWFGREDEYAIEKIGLKWPRTFRLSMYYCMVFAIYYFSEKDQQFIYFQF